MKRISRWLLVAAGTSGLLACSAIYRQAQPDFFSPAVELGPEQAHEGEVMYHYLLGQIAGVHSSLAEQERDQEKVEAYLSVAVPHLVKSAQSLDDPAIAEHAAKAAVFARDFAAALSAAERWIELQPNESRAYQYAAISAVRTNDAERAATYLSAIVELAPTVEDGLLDVGSLLSREEEEQPALQLVSDLAAAHKEPAEAPFIVANIQAKFDHHEDALQSLGEALQREPAFRGALMLKARILQKLERKEEALALLAQAVEDNPGDTELRTTYARILITDRRYSDARDQYEALFKLDPGNVDLAYRLGMLTLELNQYELSEKYFTHVLRSGKRSPEALYYLGRTEELRKNYKSALQYYMRVTEGEYRLEALLREAKMLSLLGKVDEGLDAVTTLQEANQDPELDIRFYLAKVEILVEQKDYDAAYKLLNSAIKKYPDSFDLVYSRSMVTEKLGNVKESIRDLRNLRKQDPENPDIMNALGYTLANRTTEYEEAEELISKAIKLKPDSPAITDSMGWVLYRQGKLEEALRYLRKAHAMDPDPEIAGHLGEVLWQLGQKEEATAIWDEALERDPDHDVLKSIIKQFK